MQTKLARLSLCLMMLVTLSACATQGATLEPAMPGFFMGIVHGVIAPFALIGHLFDENIRIYAVPNVGGWYDFGFLIGLSFWGGGASAASTPRGR